MKLENFELKDNFNLKTNYFPTFPSKNNNNPFGSRDRKMKKKAEKNAKNQAARKVNMTLSMYFGNPDLYPR